MAGSKETVYIKADRNVEVTDPCVKLGDILSMECANPTVLPKLKTIKLLRFHGVDKKTQNRVAVSILKVIECIHAEYPEIEVQNLGEQDFIITYEEQQSVGGGTIRKSEKKTQNLPHCGSASGNSGRLCVLFW